MLYNVKEYWDGKFFIKIMIIYRWKFLLLLCFCGSFFLSLKLELVLDFFLKSLIFGLVVVNFFFDL